MEITRKIHKNYLALFEKDILLYYPLKKYFPHVLKRCFSYSSRWKMSKTATNGILSNDDTPANHASPPINVTEIFSKRNQLIG